MKPYVKSLKANSQKLRTTPTEAEKRLWYRIRNDQLGFRFYRQKPLLNYEPQHQANDKMRDAELAALGLTVMRFDNYRVMREIDRVVEEIWLHLQSVEE